MKTILKLKFGREKHYGQGMLEFALAIPIFLLLIFGIIEFGRMFLMYTSVFASAREGARYGSAVETLCDQPGLEASARRVGFFAGDETITVQYDDGLGNAKECSATVLGDRVHVTATIHYSSITGIVPQMDLSSTARRTIVKQVFLEWTLQPTSANAGGVPPTLKPPTFTLPPPSTSTATHTPTSTYTPDPNVTPSITPTPTNTRTPTPTPTPLPPLCAAAENWQMGMTVSTVYYDLKLSNPYPGSYYLNVISISWNMAGGKVLDHIEFKSPTSDFHRVWTGPSGDGILIWYPTPPLEIEPGGDSFLRFVFRKEDVMISDISLVLDNGVSECTLSYP